MIAFDAIGNSTTSACSTDTIIVDSTPPTDNTANLQFTNLYNNTGNNVAVTWTAFTDTYLTDHRIITYTDSSCSTGANDHGLTGASTASNSTIIDGLSDGVYYATVTAYDGVGNSTTSACSTDTIEIDTTVPTDNTANLQFTDVYDNDGNNVAVTWTAFTDSNLSDHRLYTYTDSSCSTGEVDHGLIGGTGNSNTTIIDGLADGQYWAKVRALDLAATQLYPPVVLIQLLLTQQHQPTIRPISNLLMSTTMTVMISRSVGRPSLMSSFRIIKLLLIQTVVVRQVQMIMALQDLVQLVTQRSLMDSLMGLTMRQ